MAAITLLALTTFWLAYSNGANDNFKGVATLYGSGLTSFRGALTWASITTFLGSIVSIVLAEHLLKVFSGAGLVPDQLLGTGAMLVTVGFSAAVTIFISTVAGMPTSTTHALVGALLGVAWISSTLKLPWAVFLQLFVAPLLLSPVVALITTGFLYSFIKRFGASLGIPDESCICIEHIERTPSMINAGNLTEASIAESQVFVDRQENCQSRFGDSFIGFSLDQFADNLHFLSAGAVCFSRAVNDTPKIAALLLAFDFINEFTFLNKYIGLSIVAAAMTFGGLLQSRKVANTMSRKITDISPVQGLSANLVTAGLVLFASRFGMPVSTTHVACGSIFGIGMANRKIDWKSVAAILLTWLITLPFAALLSGLLYPVVNQYI